MKKRVLMFCLGLLVVCLTFAISVFSFTPEKQVFADTAMYSTDGKAPPQQSYYTLANTYTDFSSKYDGSTLASYYCMRDEYMLYAQQQSVQGLCWDFASSMTLSTTIMKSTGAYMDFSEGWISLALTYGANTGDFTTYTSNFDSYYYPGDGGWFMGFDQTAKKYGLLLEQEFDYEQSYLIDMSNYSNLYSEYSQYANHNIMQNVTAGRFNRYVGQSSTTKTKTINSIKQHIKNNGAVAAAMRWQDMSTFYRNGKSLVYKVPSQGVASGHLVAIIGWDDTISYSYNGTTYTGAWIALNSYGNEIHSTCGDRGIVYLFYDDTDFDAHLWAYEYNSTITGDSLYLRPSIQSSNATYSTKLAGAYYGSFSATTKTTKQKNIFHKIDDINVVYTYTMSASTTLDKVEIFCKGQDVTSNFSITNSTNKVTITSTNSPLGAYTVVFTYSNATSSEQTESCFYICDGTETNYVFYQIEDNCHGTVPNNKKFVNYNNLNYFNEEYLFATSVQSGIVLFKFVFSTYSEVTNVTPTTTGVAFQALQNEQIIGQISYNLASRDTYSFKITTSGGKTKTIDFKVVYKTASSYEWANVFYETNGGQNSEQNAKMELVSSTSGATLENPTKPGYDFAGWYYDKAFTSKLPQTSGKYYIQYSKLKSSTGSKGWGFGDDNIYYGKTVYVRVYAKWNKKATTGCAEIYSGGVWKQYSTLEQAITTAADGDIIFLTSDYTLNNPISVTKSITIVTDNNATLYMGSGLSGKEAIFATGLTLGSAQTSINGRTLTKLTIDGNQANVTISTFLRGSTFIMYNNVVIQNFKYTETLISQTDITMHGGIIQNNIYYNAINSNIYSLLSTSSTLSVLGNSKIINNTIQAGAIFLLYGDIVTLSANCSISGNQTTSVIRVTTFYPNGAVLENNTVVYGAIYSSGTSIDMTNVTIDSKIDLYLAYSNCEVSIGPNTNISTIKLSASDNKKYNIKVTQSLLPTQKIDLMFNNGRVHENYLKRNGEYPIITLASGATISEDNFGFILPSYQNEQWVKTEQYSIQKGTTAETLNKYYVKGIFKFYYSLNYPGSTPVIEEYEYGTTVTRIADPTRSGYTFVNWYTSDTLATPYTFGKMPASDVTVYAKWAENGYKIVATAGTGGEISPSGTAIKDYNSSQTYTFMAYVGYTIKSIKVDGVALTGTALTNAINNGYTFSNIKADHTIFVEFSVLSYTLTYDLNYPGTTPITQTYNYGQTITKITNPTRDGYAFGGWYKESTCINVFSLGTMPNVDLTIYAKWEIESYTISASADTNTTINPSGFITKKHGESQKFTFGAKTGHYIAKILVDGVALSATALQEAIVNGYTFENITENHTIKVESNTQTYTFTYKLNYPGVKDITQTYAYNTKVSKIANPTRIGYNFVNWYTDETLSTIYAFSKMPAKDVTVWAKWTIKTFTITTKVSGNGTISPSGEITKNYGESQTFTLSPQSGYAVAVIAINGSTLSASNMQDAVTNGLKIENIDKDYSISVIFEAIKYNFTYDLNYEGSEPITTQIPYGDMVALIANPTRNGYTFAGWYNEKECTTLFTVVTMPNHDVTVYAKWAINTYIITATAGENGSISPDGENKVFYGGELTFTFAADEGYCVKFIQIDDKQLSASELAYAIANGYTFVDVAKDYTIYVEFKPLAYSFVYDLNYQGGGQITQNYDYGEKVTKIEDPTRFGYYFDGWYNESECVSLYEFSTMPNSDVTVYAKWQKNTYTISASAGANGSISPSGDVQKLYGESALFEFSANQYYIINFVLVDGVQLSQDKLQDAIINGYLFENIDSDHTIYVEFMQNIFKLTYVLNYEGAENIELDIEFETPIESYIPSRDGYDFVGWYAEPHCLNPLEVFTMPNHDVTLYAKWQIRTYIIVVDCDENGNASPSGEITKQYGESITIMFEANYGFALGGLIVDGENLPLEQVELAITNGYTISEIDANHTVVAQFVDVKLTFAYDLNYEETEVITQQYVCGETINKIQDPTRENYTFEGWFAEEQCLTPYEFSTMPNHSVTVYAKWVKITHDILATAGENGYISPSGTVKANQGEDITFALVANSGYEISQIIVDGEKLDGEKFANAYKSQSYTFKDVKKPHTIEVVFKVLTFEITATAYGNGTISPTGLVELFENESITYIFDWAEGHYISRLTVDGIDIFDFDKNTYTFENVTADHTIVVEYSIKKFKIEIDIEGNCRVNCDKSLFDVAYGETRVLTFDTNEATEIKRVTVDGKEVEIKDNTIVLQNIQKNIKIYVKATEKTSIVTLIVIIGLVALVVVGGTLVGVFRSLKTKPRKEQVNLDEIRKQMEKYSNKNNQDK